MPKFQNWWSKEYFLFLNDLSFLWGHWDYNCLKSRASTLIEWHILFQKLRNIIEPGVCVLFGNFEKLSLQGFALWGSFVNKVSVWFWCNHYNTQALLFSLV